MATVNPTIHHVTSPSTLMSTPFPAGVSNKETTKGSDTDTARRRRYCVSAT